MNRFKWYAIAILAGLLFGLTLTHAGTTKAEYKITRLSLTQVGISCLNGSDSTGRKIGDIVIMSCGN